MTHEPPNQKGRWAEFQAPGESSEPRASKVDRWLDDLDRHAADAAFIVSKGRDRYDEESLEGRLLRNAAERVLINVATVAERLPDAFKARYPDVDWRGLKLMRNLVAHHARGGGRYLPLVLVMAQDYAQVLGQTIHSLAPGIPLLVIDQVGLGEGDYIDIGLPMLDGRAVPLSIKTLVFYD